VTSAGDALCAMDTTRVRSSSVRGDVESIDATEGGEGKDARGMVSAGREAGTPRGEGDGPGSLEDG
jgi:hypothetical protein